jgi:hypothetical protein
MTRPFVPADFDPPAGLATERFVLEPLGPEHAAADLAAWMSSIEDIHATPGYDDDPANDDPWPVAMTLEENRADLERHAQDFAERIGFTYTVLDPTSRDVIGCVYVYPAVDPTHDVKVRSWARASHAGLDRELWSTVSSWIASAAWPFERPDYAPRV